MGGPVGIGTVISTFGAGAIMQAVYSTIKFEIEPAHSRDFQS